MRNACKRHVNDREVETGDVETLKVGTSWQDIKQSRVGDECTAWDIKTSQVNTSSGNSAQTDISQSSTTTKHHLRINDVIAYQLLAELAVDKAQLLTVKW